MRRGFLASVGAGPQAAPWEFFSVQCVPSEASSLPTRLEAHESEG